MLEDRSYMHSGEGWKNQRSATIILLILNAVIFILHEGIRFYAKHDIATYLGLQLNDVARGWVWQLITFQFLHAGWLHIILNSLGLYIFGRIVEDTLGRKRFLIVYLGAGVCGGLL